MEVTVRVQDLLQVVPQLKTTLLNTHATMTETKGQPMVPGGLATNPMLLTVSNGRHPTMVEMGILRTILIDIIVDGGSGVNILSKEMWRNLGKSTLWPSLFNLLDTNQQGIKPLGTWWPNK